MGLLTAFKKPKKTLDLPPPPMPFEQVPLPPRPEGIPAPFPDSDQLEFPEIPAVEEEELPAWEESPLPTLSEEKETLPPRYEPPSSAPSELPKTRASLKQLFVSIDDYQAIMQGIMEAKRTIAESEQLGEELTKLKDKEDKVFEDWRGQIEDIEKKLSYVDQVISKGELA